MAFSQLPVFWVIWGYGLQITHVIIIRVSRPEGPDSEGILYLVDDNRPAALFGDCLNQATMPGPKLLTL